MIQTPRSEQSQGDLTFYVVLGVLWVVPGLVILLATVIAGGAPHTHVIDWPYAAIRSMVQGHGRVLPWQWVGARSVRSGAAFWVAVVVVIVPLLTALLVAAVTLRGGIPAVFPFLAQAPVRSRWARAGALARAGLVAGRARGRRVVLGRHRGRWIAAREGGSVLAFGAAGSGKSASLCIPAIAEWEGCVVAVSDGTDLIEVAAGVRQHRGRVEVLDVSGRTGLGTCTWSPAGPRMTFDDALDLVARVLEGREPDPDEATRQVLTCALYAAANQGAGVAAAVRWLDDVTGATLVRSLLQVADRDPRATSLVTRIFEQDRDQRAACFSASRQLLRTHFELAAPGVTAHAFQPAEFLAGGTGALFVVMPVERTDAPEAVETVLTALVAGAEGRRSQRPLLVVLDGCAAVAAMPGLAGRLASRRAPVTVLAALRDADECSARAEWDMRALAERARLVVFLGGGGGGSTPSLMHRLVRRQLVERGRRPARWDDVDLDLLSPEAARQLGYGRALLLHEQMAPAVLWARNWYEDPELQALLREHPYVRGVARIHRAS
jgi:hypothetical protein